LKNSIWRSRRSASARVSYVPNFRPVVSDSTTYLPLIFLIIAMGPAPVTRSKAGATPEGRRGAELRAVGWIGLEAEPPQAGSHRLVAGF
jgi:hypothetical protein